MFVISVLCRTQEGIKRSMQLKDAMRETCLHDLAEAWYNLLRAYQSANPDLAAAVLSTVGRYVNWIDVSLVVNERSGLSFVILWKVWLVMFDVQIQTMSPHPVFFIRPQMLHLHMLSYRFASC